MLYINYHMISLAVNTSAPLPYLGYVSKQAATAPDFPQRLADLRKQHSLTQQQLADRIGMHVVQLRRYEAGTSQPTLDVIRKLSTALQVSADMLLFGKDQRGPDDDLRLQFEAISRFDAEEKQVIRSLLDGMILKHEARRWSSPAAAAPGSAERK
jgi:transcriptional regulator with XRE-family HTH domain